MAEKVINIGGRLHDTSSNHTVTGANEVLDDDLQKKQSVINAEQQEFNQEQEGINADTYRKNEVYNKEETNNIISRTPETDVIVIDIPAASQSDIAGYLDANTPSGIDPETGRSVRANKLYRVPGPTNETYSEWAWDGTAYICLANKDYGIDNEPVKDSSNVVKSGGIYKGFANKSWYIASPRIGNPQITVTKDASHNIIVTIPSSINVFDKQGGYRNMPVGTFTVPSGKSLYLSTTENSLTPPDFSVKGTGQNLYLVLQDTLDNVHNDFLILSNWSGGIYSPFDIFYTTNTDIVNIGKRIDTLSWFITDLRNGIGFSVQETPEHDIVITMSSALNVFDKFGGYYTIASGTYTCHAGKAFYLSTTDNTLTPPDFSVKGDGSSLYLVEQAILDNDGDGDVTHADSLLLANWSGGVYSPFECFYPTATRSKQNSVDIANINSTLTNRSWYLIGVGASSSKNSDRSVTITFPNIANVFDKLGGYRNIEAGTYNVPVGKALYLSTTENTLTIPDLTVKGTAETLYLVAQDVLDNTHNDFLVMANWASGIYTPFAELSPDFSSKKDAVNRSWYLICLGMWARKNTNHSVSLVFPITANVFDKLGGYRNISAGIYNVPVGKSLYLSTTENTLTLPDLTVKGTGQTLYLVLQDTLDTVHNDFLVLSNWAGGIYSPYGNFMTDFVQTTDVSYNEIGTINRMRSGHEVSYSCLRNLVSFEKSNMIDLYDAVEDCYFVDGNFVTEPNYIVTRNPAPLERGKTYTIFGNNAHVDILDAVTFEYIAHIPKVHETDPDLNIVRDGYYQQFTIPDTDTFDNILAYVTLRKADEKVGYLNEGTIVQLQQTHYQAFRPTLGKQSNFKRILTVDISGCGDFTSLTEACKAASDGDTILVYPGLYDNEVCTAPESKTLHIIGIDREQCVIRGRADATYSTPPMHFSSGRIANLTIIQQNTVRPQEGDAYCIHLDWHNMKDHTINIDNCNFENYSRGGCLGVGLRGGCILTVKGCRFCAKHGGRALLLHDNNWDIAQYEGLQIFRSIDCIYYMEDTEVGDKTIVINGCGKETQAYTRDFSVSQFYIEFIGNRIKGGCKFGNVHSADVGTITADDFQGVKNLRLSDLSWGNSDSVLNAE